MKKKLFAVFMVVSFYVLFISAFQTADRQGYISQFFTEIGWSKGATFVETQALSEAEAQEGYIHRACLRTPMPRKKKPKGPPRTTGF